METNVKTVTTMMLPIYLQNVLIGTFYRDAAGVCKAHTSEHSPVYVKKYLNYFVKVMSELLPDDGTLPKLEEVDYRIASLSVPMWCMVRHRRSAFGIMSFSDGLLSVMLELPTVVVSMRRVALAKGKPVKVSAVMLGGGDA